MAEVALRSTILITTHRDRVGQSLARPQYLKFHAVELQKVNKRNHWVLVGTQSLICC